MSIEPLKGICKSGCEYSMLHGRGRSHTCPVFCTWWAPQLPQGTSNQKIYSGSQAPHSVEGWPLPDRWQFLSWWQCQSNPQDAGLTYTAELLKWVMLLRLQAMQVRWQTTSAVKGFSTPPRRRGMPHCSWALGEKSVQEMKSSRNEKWITHTRGEPSADSPLLPVTVSMQVWPRHAHWAALQGAHCELTEIELLHLQGEGMPHSLRKHFG